MIGTSQALLDVNQITTNNGYVEINQGQIEIVKNYDIIFHDIIPKEIEKIIDQLETNIHSMQFDDDKISVLHLEIKNLRSKLKTIVPHRQRRGLLNLIGTIHKWLYGTMDNEDRENIEQHLSVIDTNNHNLIKNTNQQVIINRNFNESLGKLKDMLEKDRVKILESFNHINSQYKRIASQTFYIDYILKIKILHDNLEHIQDNIAASRSGILHSNILTPQEIDEYSIDANKLQNLKIGSLQTKSDHIIFVIMVPRENIFVEKIAVYPITNNKFEELLFEPLQIVNYNNKTYNFENSKELSKLKLCNSCIIRKDCEKILNKVLEVIEIETGIVLVKNAKNTSLTNNCNQRIRILNGNYLLKFRNCTINLDKHILYNNEKKFKQSFIVNKLETHIQNLNKKLSFDEIVLNQVENTKEIIELKYQKDTNLALNIVITFTVVISIVIVIVTLKIKGNKVKINIAKTQESLRLKEGGVISEVPSDNTLHVSPILCSLNLHGKEFPTGTA